jgi:hypothetical protein
MFRKLFYVAPKPEPRTEGWLKGELNRWDNSRPFMVFPEEPLIPPDDSEDFPDFSPTD